MSLFLCHMGKRLGWYALTLAFAVLLNFGLPRLVPGDPVSQIVSKMESGGFGSERSQKRYQTYMVEFGLDRPLWRQFANYLAMLARGKMGTSFSQYPCPVSELLGEAIPWSLALQLPALLIGWVAGNLLGAVAAWRKGVFDSTLMPVSLFLNSIPHYALGIVLLYVLGRLLGLFPLSGGYDMALTITFSLPFIRSYLYHYALPFLSIVLVMIGGQAIGMREMAIYELESDYVLYSRSLGIRGARIGGYVFRNAVLPQITGFATSLGRVVGGSLVTEVIFSYPGIGYTLFTAIKNADYPVIQGCTLVITVAVLMANFLMDICYGLIDPRIRAAEVEEAGA